MTILLSAPSYYNVFQPVEFQAEASIPAAQFVWEFQDGSQSVVTANGMASHRYSLPGKYTVRVRTEAPQPEAETTVTMAVAVDMAELYCPAVAQTGQSLEVWLQANQGTDLQAVYSIQMADGQLLTGRKRITGGGGRYQIIFLASVTGLFHSLNIVLQNNHQLTFNLRWNVNIMISTSSN